MRMEHVTDEVTIARRVMSTFLRDLPPISSTAGVRSSAVVAFRDLVRSMSGRACAQLDGGAALLVSLHSLILLGIGRGVGAARTTCAACVFQACRDYLLTCSALAQSLDKRGAR